MATEQTRTGSQSVFHPRAHSSRHRTCPLLRLRPPAQSSSPATPPFPRRRRRHCQARPYTAPGASLRLQPGKVWRKLAGKVDSSETEKEKADTGPQPPMPTSARKKSFEAVCTAHMSADLVQTASWTMLRECAVLSDDSANRCADISHLARRIQGDGVMI